MTQLTIFFEKSKVFTRDIQVVIITLLTLMVAFWLFDIKLKPKMWAAFLSLEKTTTNRTSKEIYLNLVIKSFMRSI